MKTRIAVFITAIACIFCMNVPTVCAEVSEDSLLGYAKSIIVYEKNVNDISPADSVLSGKILENASYDSSDWLAIGASRFGFDEDYEAYGKAWENNFLEYLKTDHDPYAIKPTEYHRAVLTALAVGKDPTDISGHDLVADGIYDFDHLRREGSNGYVWALIAVDSLDWLTPEDAKNTRFTMIREIAMEQQEDGGFALNMSFPSDPDLTAMVLQSFAPYKDHEIISVNVERGAEFLENAYKNGKCTTCETLSQMICAYCALGEGYTSRDIYSDMVEEFLSYSREDGGFAHLKEDIQSSEMASCQALLALSAMVRQQKGCRDLYDFQPEPRTADRRLDSQYMGKNTSGRGYIFDLENMREYIPHESMVSPASEKLLAVLMLLIPCGIGVTVGVIAVNLGKQKNREDK